MKFEEEQDRHKNDTVHDKCAHNDQQMNEQWAVKLLGLFPEWGNGEDKGKDIQKS